MTKHLTVFRIIYLLFLVFVLIHFILGLFGLAFTPIVWNIWFLALGLTLFIHPWTIFYKTRIFQWHHLIFQALSGFFALLIWLVIFFFLSFFPDSSIPVSIDYHIQDKKIIIVRGFVIHSTYEHHEILNPFIMKSEVKYNEDLF